MKIKYLVLAVALSLGLVGAVTSVSQPVSAATNNAKYYKTYKSIPKPLWGTWRTMGYTEYNGESNKKVRWTYSFKKHTYSQKVDFQGKRKSKTIHFLKNEIRDIDYRYKTKRYEIYQTAVKTMSKLAYDSIIYLKPVRHNGKKVLEMYPRVDNHTTYLYKQ